MTSYKEMEKMRAGMKRAAGVLIIEEGKILAVSRKDDVDNFGIPAGAAEEDETFEQCALRELFEETGLIGTNPRVIFVEKDDFGWTMATVVIEKRIGDINTTEKGIVEWVEPKKLLEGSFSKYNKSLFNSIALE
jgi:8-oxo-dGTP pyrophosphatase MutT (NUDIX family)